MAQSDITIDALDKVGKEDAEYLVSLVRSVPDFPKEGIIFRDFMPVLADAKGLRILLNALEQALPVPPSEFDSIAGLESRGFLFGPAMAAHLGKGFIAVRKAGKLPKPLANPTTSSMAQQALKSRPLPFPRANAY
ncbi:Adenine phosphoribosyltransferase [Bifidobacterium breve]|nr:Adenine phosphoribosyltransferase [Bifidobacterium breve]